MSRLCSSDSDPFVFLGVPTHCGSVDIGTVRSVLRASRLCRCACEFSCSSLLAQNFNGLYCNALNLKRGGLPVTHFCLLHADIVPQSENWLNEMVQEMQRCKVDVLSSVVPIKDGRGLTSTAMCMSDPSDSVKSRTRRITIHESMVLPTTFDKDDAASCLKYWESDRDPILLVNTGLLLIDLRSPFSEQFFFTINDEIRLQTASNGDDVDRFVSHSEPEDWCFSRLLHRLGVRYAATRAVDVVHVGRFEYDSRVSWGVHHDPVHFPVTSP